MLGVGDALRADPRVFVYGEDVGGSYGNAFLLLRPLLEGVRRSHHQLAARRGRGARRLRRRGARRPAADRRDAVQRLRRHRLQSAREQRREDPLPLGRRRCRWSCACRGAACATPGPYHSQNTEPWFYRTPGLKIVVPSTPHDARALMAAAVADPDPVLYYEHIALYRDPRIKQALADGAAGAAAARPRRAAARRRRPRDHLLRRLRARRRCAWRSGWPQDGIEASVLDLRTLVPLDREARAGASRATAAAC